MHPNDKNYLEGFQAFVDEEGAAPPAHLTQEVRSRVLSLLAPSPASVWRKVILIHVVSGAMSLLVCPQFGLSLGSDWLMTEVFMRGGAYLCTFLCGALFLGVGSLASRLILSVDERRVLSRPGVLSTLAIALAAFGVLSFLGSFPTLVFSGLWILGAWGATMALVPPRLRIRLSHLPA